MLGALSLLITNFAVHATEHLRRGRVGRHRPPAPTAVPVAVPKTGHMSEQMATCAATNIAADVTGKGERADGLYLPVTCVADAGDIAMYIKADPFLPPRNRVVLKRGARYHYLKLAFERFYLEKVKAGPARHALRVVGGCLTG